MPAFLGVLLGGRGGGAKAQPGPCPTGLPRRRTESGIFSVLAGGEGLLPPCPLLSSPWPACLGLPVFQGSGPSKPVCHVCHGGEGSLRGEGGLAPTCPRGAGEPLLFAGSMTAPARRGGRSPLRHFSALSCSAQVSSLISLREHL